MCFIYMNNNFKFNIVFYISQLANFILFFYMSSYYKKNSKNWSCIVFIWTRMQILFYFIYFFYLFIFFFAFLYVSVQHENVVWIFDNFLLTSITLLLSDRVKVMNHKHMDVMIKSSNFKWHNKMIMTFKKKYKIKI